MVKERLFTSLFHRTGQIIQFNQPGQRLLRRTEKIRSFRNHLPLYTHIRFRAGGKHGGQGFCKLCHILDHGRNKLLACHINHRPRFDINNLGIGFVFDFGAGFQFGAGKYIKFLKKLYRLFRRQRRDGIYHGADIGKAPLFRFLYPCIRIAVAVKNNLPVIGKHLLN